MSTVVIGGISAHEPPINPLNKETLSSQRQCARPQTPRPGPGSEQSCRVGFRVSGLGFGVLNPKP